MKIIPIDISFPFKLLYLKRFRKIIISLLQAETALYAWTHTNCATLHRKTSYFYCENAEDEFTPSCNMLGYQAKWYYRVVSLKWRNLNIKTLHCLLHRKRLWKPENTHYREKNHCMSGLQFDWFGFRSFRTFKIQHIFLFGYWRPAVRWPFNYCECSRHKQCEWQQLGTTYVDGINPRLLKLASQLKPLWHHTNTHRGLTEQMTIGRKSYDDAKYQMKQQKSFQATIIMDSEVIKDEFDGEFM